MGWEGFMKVGVKILPKVGNLLKGGAASLSKAAGCMYKNWGATLALGGVAYAKAKEKDGEGLISSASRQLLGEKDTADIKKKGLVGGASGFLFGEDSKNKPIAENVTDVLFGQGSYKTVKDGAGNVVSEATGAYQSAKGALTNRDAPVVGGSGMVNDQSAQYAQVAPYNGVNDYIGRMTNGNVSNMNAIELAVAAYMMFSSRFGWLSKIGGAVLGGVATKDITNRQSLRQARELAVLKQNYDNLSTQPEKQLPQQPPLEQAEEMSYVQHRNR